MQKNTERGRVYNGEKDRNHKSKEKVKQKNQRHTDRQTKLNTERKEERQTYTNNGKAIKK